MIDYGSARKLMGLPGKETNPIALIDRISAGLPLKVLERVVSAASGSKPATPAYTEIAMKIIPKATLSRRVKAGALTSREGEVVARLAGILAFATEVWGDIDTAREFLMRPHIMLEGRRPIDLALKSEIGAAAVTEILGRLQYGSAA